MPTSHEELLLPREVAAILRVTPRTLRNWDRRGILVPVRLPTGQKRYRREDVEALLLGKHTPKDGRQPDKN